MNKGKLFLFTVLGLLVLVSAILYLYFVSKNVEVKTMDDEARKGVSGRFVKLTAGMTHYEASGPDTGKTIILVHGFSVPYYIWVGLYDSLIHEGFHVIRYDEFGRGFSDRPDMPYNPELYRTQLADLISSLHLKTPVILAGVSFGGAVVSDFAAHNPSLVDKVILIDPVYAWKKNSTNEMLINYTMAVNPEKQVAGQMDDFKYPIRFPHWTDAYKVQMQYKGFRHALASTIAHYSWDSIYRNYRALNALHKPVLLIWGKEDHTVEFSFSDSLRQILHADFFPVDDAAHLPYLEQPAIVDKKIISWIRIFRIRE